MSIEEIVFFASPLIPIALAFWCRTRAIRSFILFIGLMSLIGLLIHIWASGEGDGLNAPTIWILALYVYVVPVLVIVALLFELVIRIQREMSDKGSR